MFALEIPYWSILTASALIALLLSYMAWRSRPATGAGSFILLMWCIAEWSLTYAVETASPDLRSMLFWAKTEYFGITMLPVAWLLFSLQYSGRGKWLTPRRVLLLCVEPAFILLMVWTNESHNLFWTQWLLLENETVRALVLGHGLFFWLHLAYAYVLLLVGSLALLQAPIRHPDLYRGQTLILLTGVLLPWIGNAIYISGVIPQGFLDLTPFVFSLSGAVLYLGLARFKLLDIIPIAREIAIESMEEAVFVLDDNNLLVELNPSAKKLLTKPPSEILHQPASVVFARWPELASQFVENIIPRLRLELTDEGQYHYDTSIRLLRDRRGQPIGKLLVLRDVSVYKSIESALRNREKFLALLGDITRTSLKADDLRTVLQILADKLGELFHSSGCFITLWDDIQEKVVPAAAYGPLRETYPAMDAQDGQHTLTASALNAGHPLVVEDVFNSPYVSPEIAAKFSSRSLLGLPLVAGDRKLGAILVAYDDPHLFTPEEIRRGEQVSEQISLAVAKAYLLEETFRRARSFEALNEALEQRVLERTAELETINRELETEVIERIQVEGKIKQRLEMEQALSRISALFLGSQGFDQAVADTLEVTGNVTQAHRAYLYLLRQGGKLMDNTHEWCRQGVWPQIDNLQGLSTDIFPWWIAKLRAGETIYVQNVDDLPPEAHAEKEILQQQDIQSVLVYPVYAGDELAGFIGLDNVNVSRQWPQEDLVFLKIFAQILGSALYRKQVEDEIKTERASLAVQVRERTASLSAANDQLIHALQSKDEFLATMSHELRTPLNAVLGLSEALQEEVYGSLTERQRKSLLTIEESGRHLLSLINDILDLSKIEAGKLELQSDVVPVDILCRASIKLVEPMARSKSIQLSYKIDLPFNEVYLDPRRFKQILVNLLNNAVKFTPEGGQVGLEVTTQAGANTIFFTVWDTGMGISQENQARLFKPFIQIDSGLARHHEGTGLGLALVSRLVGLHGGEVSLQSEPGKGSRFTIAIPLYVLQPVSDEGGSNLNQAVIIDQVKQDSLFLADNPADQAAPPAIRNPAITPVTNGRPMILLAEDNETNIKMVSEFLRYKGYTIQVARNGIEAVEQARTAFPDLILMDVQMPEMDGLEAIRQIRLNPAIAKTPIVALTALAMAGDRERCISAGANDYLAKPVNLKAMLDCVQSYLSTG